MLTMETYPFPKKSKEGNAYLSLPLTTKEENTSLPLMKKNSTYPCLLQIVFVALKRLKHDDQSFRKKTQNLSCRTRRYVENPEGKDRTTPPNAEIHAVLFTRAERK